MNEFDIVKVIYETSKNTSPVTLQFGRLQGTTCVKGIVIKECPPAIITRLVEMGCFCEATNDGVLVYKP